MRWKTVYIVFYLDRSDLKEVVLGHDLVQGLEPEVGGVGVPGQTKAIKEKKACDMLQ